MVCKIYKRIPYLTDDLIRDRLPSSICIKLREDWQKSNAESVARRIISNMSDWIMRRDLKKGREI